MAPVTGAIGKLTRDEHPGAALRRPVGCLHANPRQIDPARAGLAGIIATGPDKSVLAGRLGLMGSAGQDNDARRGD